MVIQIAEFNEGEIGETVQTVTRKEASEPFSYACKLCESLELRDQLEYTVVLNTSGQ